MRTAELEPARPCGRKILSGNPDTAKFQFYLQLQKVEGKSDMPHPLRRPGFRWSQVILHKWETVWLSWNWFGSARACWSSQ